MKLWNYGLQHPPGKGCSTPLVEGAAPPSRGSSTPWQRVQHPLALILAPSEVLDFAKLLMYLSSQVHLWSSVLWMLEEYYLVGFKCFVESFFSGLQGKFWLKPMHN